MMMGFKSLRKSYTLEGKRYVLHFRHFRVLSHKDGIMRVFFLIQESLYVEMFVKGYASPTK